MLALRRGAWPLQLLGEGSLSVGWPPQDREKTPKGFWPVSEPSN